jgi:hypothetical protein
MTRLPPADANRRGELLRVCRSIRQLARQVSALFLPPEP